MNTLHFTQEQLAKVARLSDEDMALINACRGAHNRLGLAYQLAFVRLFNQFPSQVPFEPLEDIVTYMSLQLNTASDLIGKYEKRRETIAEHRKRIQEYLQLKPFHPTGARLLGRFLYNEALQIEPTDSLLVKAVTFLKSDRLLNPAEDTLRRLIYEQRKRARRYIFTCMSEQLSTALKACLDSLLMTDEQSLSEFHQLKEAPQKPSTAGMKLLTHKLSVIEQTGVLGVDLSWLNNNYKRSLSNYAVACDAYKLRALSSSHRYAALVCYLQDNYQDTIDYCFDMYTKALTSAYSHAETVIDDYARTKRTTVRTCLHSHKKLCKEVIALANGKRTATELLQSFPQDELQVQVKTVEALLAGKYSNSINVVTDRLTHLRRFTRPLLEKLAFEITDTGDEELRVAVELLTDLTTGNKRQLPDDVPLTFLPKATQKAVVEHGKINPRKYEVAVCTALRDHVVSGNLAITGSKRFGQLDHFFVDTPTWEARKDAFYQKAKLPRDPATIASYLTNRLQTAFDDFLHGEPQNTFAKATKEGWLLSADSAEVVTIEQKQRLEQLIQWFTQHMRTIKLPNLLIEVDNDLRFTDAFMPPARRTRTAENVCTVLTTIMAYGCNIGPHTIAQMIEGVGYKQIKHTFDWQLTGEAQRHALAQVVNGISGIEVTKTWGAGRTSASDGQRFGYHQKTLHRTFSHRFNDFAIEFYTFVADNYAPFYNLAKETTDRDSSKVLDGHLYNVSDLEIEEHYTDTHGYTELNFAAFAWLGIAFSPRIKNIKSQWLYKIEDRKDYGSLAPFVSGSNHTIKMQLILDNWDRMAQFYASLEAGQATASTALKRLVGFSGKNRFYQANVQLGRILKTEHILHWMADPAKRKRTRRGLLKVEQIHQLARSITYGNRGRFKGKTLEEVNSSGNCTTLIMAAIIYWQAKEMSRIVQEYNPDEAGVDISLLAHISPIEWSNVILYGEYKLNRDLVRQ